MLVKRVFATIVVGLFVVLASQVAAQEATPPDSFELQPGVTADNMVFREGQEAPVLYNLHFEPEVVYAIEPSPSLELGYMVEGSLSFTLDADVIVGVAGASDSAGDIVPAGTEFTLSPGDYVVLRPGMTGEVRNEGTDTATLSVAGIIPEAATPAA
jgi:quercetin dioxygenase-like cupin family protein